MKTHSYCECFKILHNALKLHAYVNIYTKLPQCFYTLRQRKMITGCPVCSHWLFLCDLKISEVSVAYALQITQRLHYAVNVFKVYKYYLLCYTLTIALSSSFSTWNFTNWGCQNLIVSFSTVTL